MKICLVILAFFIQPVFWIGLIRSYLDGRTRIRRARKEFNTAVYEKHYELRHFWGAWVVLGILGSLVAFWTGLTVSATWLWLYELITGVSLILLPAFPVPILLLVITSLVMIGIPVTGFANQNYLLLAGLIILALGFFIKLTGGRYEVPRIFRDQRNHPIAGYPFKELSVIPLLAIIPGNAVQHLISFYPTFVIAGHRVSLVLVPVLLGLRLTVFKHTPRKVFNKISNRLIGLGIAGMLLAIASYRWPEIIVIGLVALLLIGWWILASVRKADVKNGRWFTRAVNGVRVVGIEPHTPAERMNLHVGDVIMDVDHQAVQNEAEFYAALEKHPTYCRLRVMNRNRRIILTGTAIYKGAPHDIGAVLFRDPKA